MKTIAELLSGLQQPWFQNLSEKKFTSNSAQVINGLYKVTVVDELVHSYGNSRSITINDYRTLAAMLEDSEELRHRLHEAFHFRKIFVSHGSRGIQNKRDIRRILALGIL